MIMKNEIKEILDKLKDKNNYISHSMILLSIKETAAILDCITNLQEEIERQSKAQVILDNQITEMYDYKSRNEKALEYIKRFENQPWYVEGCQIKDLKSLLQGDDKE